MPRQAQDRRFVSNRSRRNPLLEPLEDARWVRIPVIALAAVFLAGCVTGDDGASSPADTAPATVEVSGEAANAEESAAKRWVPVPGDTWQWQLTGALDSRVDARIYDVDYERTSRVEVARLHRDGRRVICYLSVGSWEDFRPDSGGFPDEVLGKVMDGWPDERWLDIRRQDILLPLLAARMDICAHKGFDAVEPDNVDGYRNETGFELSSADQLSFNRAVARLAHERGLSVALKNDLDQIPDLVGDFDFAINEQCALYGECGDYLPFTEAGKAVLHVEYEGSLDFCAESARLGLSSMLKPLDLGADRQPC